MKPAFKILFLILALAPLALRSAEREERVAEKGELLFSDDFERAQSQEPCASQP